MTNMVRTVAPDQAEILNIVSVAGLKANLRIQHTNEDAFIQDCLLEAYDFFDGPDGWLRRAIITQTWQMSLPGFMSRQFYSDNGKPMYRWVPSSCIEIPVPPLQSVTSIGYMVDGSYETLPTSSYDVVTGTLFGTVSLKSGMSWPTGIDTSPAAVRIEFVAGYGNGAAVLEQARGIAKCIKLLASDAFRNREDTYAEPRLVAVNRKIINGLERFGGRYRIRNDHA